MARGRLTFNKEFCKACELCIKFCTNDVLGLDKGYINSSGYHPVSAINLDKCNGCGTCALMCPDIVIMVERE